MRSHISYTALCLALVGGATAAQAQTVFDQPLVTAPAGTVVQPMQTVQPLQTVQTTETVRTVRPAYHAARQVVTTRTVTRRIVSAPTVIARTTVTTTPQRLYDMVTPAPAITSSDDDYSSPPLYNVAAPRYSSPPLYDVAAPTPVVTAVPSVAIPPAEGGYTEPFIYRYVYEPNRILVIDPNTGIAVQAIPR
jgi:hypothetical protein